LGIDHCRRQLVEHNLNIFLRDLQPDVKVGDICVMVRILVFRL
jgi:hypothetical protein